MTSISERQLRYVDYTTDVLLYIVVLNLFVEHVDAIIIDSFTISIFTAIVLKVILDVIVNAEHRVSDYFKSQNRPLSPVFRALAVWLIMFLSKFVILEVIDVIFGEHVELGGFLLVLVLVAALMIARALSLRIFKALGEAAATA